MKVKIKTESEWDLVLRRYLPMPQAPEVVEFQLEHLLALVGQLGQADQARVMAATMHFAHFERMAEQVRRALTSVPASVRTLLDTIATFGRLAPPSRPDTRLSEAPEVSPPKAPEASVELDLFAAYEVEGTEAPWTYDGSTGRIRSGIEETVAYLQDKGPEHAELTGSRRKHADGRLIIFLRNNARAIAAELRQLRHQNAALASSAESSHTLCAEALRTMDGVTASCRRKLAAAEQNALLYEAELRQLRETVAKIRGKDLRYATWIVALNEYQRGNLLWLLSLLGYGGAPIGAFGHANTGDWCGELFGALGGGHSDVPSSNMSREDMTTLVERDAARIEALAMEKAAAICEETAEAMARVGPLGAAGALEAAKNIRAQIKGMP